MTTITSESKLVASLLKSANEKPLVQSSLSFIKKGYALSSELAKKVTPNSVTTKWEAAETYLLENQDEFVNVADKYVEVASKFVNEVNDKRKEGAAVDFLLERVEEFVNDDADDQEEVEAVTTSARLYNVGGKVSKTFYKKATAGLENLKQRTDDVVHVDLMSYANEFIDASVKPRVEYVTGLPTTVADKFKADVYEPVKAKGIEVQANIQSVQANIQSVAKESVFEPVKSVYDMKVKDGKPTSEVLLHVRNLALVKWSDNVVEPLANYLDVENLKVESVKPVIVKYATDKYDVALKYGNDKVSALTTVASDYANTLTTKPVNELSLSEVPASVYEKLSAEASKLYLEVTGEELSVNTAPLVLYDLTIAKVNEVLDSVKTKLSAN